MKTPWLRPPLGDGAVFALLLASLFFACTAVPAAETDELDWSLERQSGGEVDWTGSLPGETPHRNITWRARAVWVSAHDGATTRLLADSGRQLTKYLPGRRTRLSRIAAPPGPGLLVLSLDGPTRTSRWVGHAIVDAGRSSNQVADTFHAFAESLRSGRENGLRDPRAEALAAIGRAVLEDDALPAALAWLDARIASEHGPLVDRRDGRTPRDAVPPNPPMGDLVIESDGARARWVVPWGTETEDVFIAALDAPLGVENLEDVVRCGFNALGPSASAEARAAAPRYNLGVLEAEQVESLRVLTPEDFAQPGGVAAPPPGFVLRCDDVSELIDAPWRLWRASRLAVAGRASPAEAAAVPGPPDASDFPGTEVAKRQGALPPEAWEWREPPDMEGWPRGLH